MYVNQLLDREEQDKYFVNVTASDGLFVSQAAVEITVMDSNDNSPVCGQVRRCASGNPSLALTVSCLKLGCCSNNDI